MFVRSKLEYCSILLGNIGSSKSLQLERVQRNFVALLHDRFLIRKKLYSYESISSFYGITSIEKRRLLTISLFLFNCLHNKILCSSFLPSLHIIVRSRRMRHDNFIFKFLHLYDTDPWFFAVKLINILQVSGLDIFDSGSFAQTASAFIGGVQFLDVQARLK